MIKLPDLPWEKNALEPVISQETIEYHWWKHHKAYVDNFNKFVEDTPYQNMELEEAILASYKDKYLPVFNNGAQAWNHTFYWNCLSPNWWWEPQWELAEKIKYYFGSFEEFKNKFTEVATKHFWSWWWWLVEDKNWDLKIYSTLNADTPMIFGDKALLTVDVWEHAYYIDYRNERPKYVLNIWQIINWEFVENNLKK